MTEGRARRLGGRTAVGEKSGFLLAQEQKRGRCRWEEVTQTRAGSFRNKVASS